MSKKTKKKDPEREAYSNRKKLMTVFTRGTLPYTTNSFGQVTLGTENKSYEGHPSWRYFISQHLDVGGGYSRDILQILRSEPAYCAGRLKVGLNNWQPYECTAINSILSLPWDLTLADTACDNEALRNLKRALAKDDLYMNALVPLAELKDIRHLAKSLISSFIDFIEICISLKTLNRRKFDKAISHLWLTWSFGIKPMVADLENALDVFNKEHVAQTFRATGGPVMKDWKQPYSLNNTQWSRIGQGPMQYYSGSYTCTYSVSYHAGALLRVATGNNYSALASLCRDFNLNLQAGVSAVWELIPFSWLFDYFVNIGEVLDDTFVTPSYTTTYCYKSVHSFRQLDLVGVSLGDPSFKGIESPQVLSVAQSCFRRTKENGIPARSLAIRSTDDLGRNWVAKLANLFAILFSTRFKAFEGKNWWK